jgi:hypothetical protein
MIIRGPFKYDYGTVVGYVAELDGHHAAVKFSAKLEIDEGELTDHLIRALIRSNLNAALDRMPIIGPLRKVRRWFRRWRMVRMSQSDELEE